MQAPVIESKRARSRISGRATPRLVGTHRALFAAPDEKRCDLCDQRIGPSHKNEGGGSGLYVWTRGEEVRYEEPPLCATCGHDVALAATRHFEEEDEEEG